MSASQSKLSPESSIQLAPANKRGLLISSPLMAGSGAAGFGDIWPSPLTASDFGAVVTGPVSMRPRRGTAPPRIAELPAGFIYATGDHNPGFHGVMRRHGLVWSQAQTPIIVSLVGGDAGDRAWMAERLDDFESGIAGIELPVPEDVNLGEASAFISAVRHVTTLPILVKLPATRASHLARACVVAGADALVVGTPPPVLYPAGEDGLLEAPIAGPIALPFTLRALQRVADMDLGVPLIAAGGIASLDDIALCLELGSVAVQLRSLIWIDPLAAARLAYAAPSLVPPPA